MRRLTVATTARCSRFRRRALAASGSGDRSVPRPPAPRRIEVVDAHHRGSRVPLSRVGLPKLHAGSRISFRRPGRRSAGQGRRRRSSRRLVPRHGGPLEQSIVAIRLADGRTISFSSKQVRRGAIEARPAPRSTASGRRLASDSTSRSASPDSQAGVTVLVDRHGRWPRQRVDPIAFPDGSRRAPPSRRAGRSPHVDSDAFLLRTADGPPAPAHGDRRSRRPHLQRCATSPVSPITRRGHADRRHRQ